MFEVRETQSEFLDSPDCDPQLAYSSYKFMQLVNRFAGGIRTVEDFLEKEISSNGRNHAIKILDIGAGTCDIPLAVMKWAGKISQRIEFTCIETNETALKIASENIRKSGLNSIKLRRENIFEMDFTHNFDYVTGSMFFHHFEDEQILSIIEKLRPYVLRAILINDLRRSLLSYASCFFLTCPLSRGVKHDALLSIRRGFKSEELRRLLGRITDSSFTVEIKNPFRLVAVLRFDRGVR